MLPFSTIGHYIFTLLWSIKFALTQGKKKAGNLSTPGQFQTDNMRSLVGLVPQDRQRDLKSEPVDLTFQDLGAVDLKLVDDRPQFDVQHLNFDREVDDLRFRQASVRSCPRRCSQRRAAKEEQKGHNDHRRRNHWAEKRSQPLRRRQPPWILKAH